MTSNTGLQPPRIQNFWIGVVFTMSSKSGESNPMNWVVSLYQNAIVALLLLQIEHGHLELPECDSDLNSTDKNCE